MSAREGDAKLQELLVNYRTNITKVTKKSNFSLLLAQFSTEKMKHQTKMMNEKLLYCVVFFAGEINS